MLTYFYCGKCSRVLHMDNYRSHMVRAHNGRSDCVLGLTTLQSHLVARGMSPHEACYPNNEAYDPGYEAALT